MDKLRKMAVFARVVELGSFAAAANDQNLSPAIVGRHVADLETMLDQRLIKRTTRSMEVTEAGQRYYLGCKAMLEHLSALEQEVRDPEGDKLSGVIRLAAPDGMSPILLDAIHSFQEQHPDVLFDLLLQNQQTDLVSANIDLAIRLAISLDDSTLMVRKLGQTRLALFAAPSYIREHGKPQAVEDLGKHHCIAFGGSRFGDSWPLIATKGVEKLRLPWRLVVNQTQTFRQALVQGMGIGLVPEIMVSDLEAGGALLPAGINRHFPELGIYAVWQNKDFRPDRVSRFLDHLRERIHG